MATPAPRRLAWFGDVVRRTDASFMLGRRRRRRPNIKLAWSVLSFERRPVLTWIPGPHYCPKGSKPDNYGRLDQTKTYISMAGENGPRA